MKQAEAAEELLARLLVRRWAIDMAIEETHRLIKEGDEKPAASAAKPKTRKKAA